MAAQAGQGHSAQPTLSRGLLFAVSWEGLLRALDPESGEPVWELDLGEKYQRCQPVVSDGILYLAGDGGSVFALETEAARLVWSRKVGICYHGNISLEGELLCVADESGIYGLGRARGDSLWHVGIPADMVTACRGLVFCITREEGFLVIRAKDGKVLETHPALDSHFWSAPVVADDRLTTTTHGPVEGSMSCYRIHWPADR